MAIVVPTGSDTTTWLNWTNSTSTTMPTTADRIWYSWTANTTATSYNTYKMKMTISDTIWNGWQNGPITPAPYRTPEELQAEADAAQARREEASRQALARQQVAAQAQERAMELLHAILTEEERRYMLEHDEILVRSEHGNMYVIEKRSVHGNIRQTDEHGCLLGRICVAPRMYDEESRTLPLADGWVGQYLMLKHDEDLIIGRGNWSQRRECQHQDVPILEIARAA